MIFQTHVYSVRKDGWYLGAIDNRQRTPRNVAPSPPILRDLFLISQQKRFIGGYIYELVNDLDRFYFLLKYVVVGPCRRLFRFLAGVRRQRLIRD
jgi:hypothetical protein